MMRMILKTLVSLLVLPSLTSALAAQVASQVADLSPGQRTGSTTILSIERLGDRVVMLAAPLETGGPLKIVASDGTAAGTETLTTADLPSWPRRRFNEPAEQGFVHGAGRLFWAQGPELTSGCGSRRVWVTDATTAGTLALSPCGVSVEGDLLSAGNLIWFKTVGLQPGRHHALWVTDGTPEGTRSVLPIDGTRFSSRIEGVARFRDRVYILGQDPSQGAGLWVSDGTNAGTRLVRTLQPLADVGFGLAATSTDLFFWTLTPIGRQELWASEGTATGTRLVSSFPSGSVRRVPIVKAVDNRIVFPAFGFFDQGEEVWQSDGTPAGTKALTQFRHRQPFGNGSSSEPYSPNWIFELGDAVLVVARDEDDADEVALWRLDATAPKGIRRLAGCGWFGHVGLAWQPTRIGNRLYFRSSDRQPGEFGRELLSSTDGTAGGTRTDVSLCPEGCTLLDLSASQGTLYYSFANTLVSPYQAELWRFDPETATHAKLTLLGQGLDAAGWFEIAPLARGSVMPAWNERYGMEPHWLDANNRLTLLADLETDLAGSHFGFLGRVGSKAIFLRVASQAPTAPIATDGREIWALGSDDDDPPSCCWEGSFTETHENGPYLIYALTGSNSRETNLWGTNGTAGGTAQLTEFSVRGSFPRQQLATVLGPRAGRLYFVVSEQLSSETVPRSVLWSTDGTLAGTARLDSVANLPPDLVNAVDIGGIFYFTASVDISRRADLWRTDLTEAGTFRVARLPSFEASALQGSHVAGRTFLLLHLSRIELWGSDGTASGTARIATFGEEQVDASFPPLVQLGSNLYFWAPNRRDTVALWKVDGATANTEVLHEIRLSSDRPRPSLVSAGSALLFEGHDDLHGNELWASDGTRAGTRLVRDIFPGPVSSRVRDLVVAGGRAFFAAGDGVHGHELWSTDGTTEGTRLVHDLRPGPEPSLVDSSDSSVTPPILGATDERLFVVANDGISGTELWSVPLSPVGPLCADAANGLCLQGNRFRAEAHWRDSQGNEGVGRPATLTADTGYFWFFDPANVELVTKQLDGRELNHHFWTFYGALSNVEYYLTLTDTETGLTRRFFNPLGQLASVADTESFGPRGADLASFTAPAPAESVAFTIDAATSFAPRAASGTCAPSTTTLCLANGRFSVEASWTDFAGNQGSGQTRALTGDTGAFWFFGPDNLEVLLKVLDGTALNGKFWVFYGALSNVEYRLTLTDTTTGTAKTYTNPRGRLASVADTGAF